MTETKTTTSPLEAVYADIVNNTYREARAGMSHRKFWRVYELATEGNALLLAEDTETTESVDKVLGFFSDTIRHDIMNDPSGQALAAFAEAHRRYKTLGESLLLA